MSGWVKLDNALSEVLARKAITRGLPPVSDRAFRLYISAMCFCSQSLSDGLVPAAEAKRLTATANKRTIDELLSLGLFEQTDGGDFVVHDYLDYNPSRDRVRQLKEDAKARTTRWRGRDGNGDASHNASRDASGDGERARHPRGRDRSGTRRTGSVVPIEAEENAGENGNSKPTETELQRATEDTLLIVDTLAEQIRQRDPKAKVKPRSEPWLREARRLIELDCRTRDEILEVLRWLPTHRSGDFSWSAVILSMGKLREQFTQLTIAMSNDKKTGRRRNGRATEMKHGAMEAQNEQWAAWLHEHMPDIPFEDGQLHMGAFRALFRIGKPASELSVEAHAAHIRASVAAYDREAEQPDAA